MRDRRGLEPVRLLCSGPGKLAQALGIGITLDGQPLDQPPFTFHRQVPKGSLMSGPRIGITKAAAEPWRFGLAGSPFLSKRF
jgi:DNA-3-methyladenine glycosylase